MGLLQNGQWVDKWYDTKKSGGEFKRQDSWFRNWLTADGTAGPTGEAGFSAEKDRYHLYVSITCPWAHRTLVFRVLKELQDYIDVTVVNPLMLDNGWEFDQAPHAEPLYGFDYVYQLYLKANTRYEGRVTVPVLWDKKTETIVSNESAEIIRMFNAAFNQLTGNTDDYYPEPLREQIDAINERVYNSINNGVYKAGFSTTQEAYEKAYNELFESLEWVEGILTKQRYLTGNQITEADWRLFTTLVRFDAVYYSHFKCNKQRIADYPALSGYLRELYQIPGIAGTVDINKTKKHYYGSMLTINPTGIVPSGPSLEFNLPHGRDVNP